MGTCSQQLTGEPRDLRRRRFDCSPSYCCLSRGIRAVKRPVPRGCRTLNFSIGKTMADTQTISKKTQPRRSSAPVVKGARAAKVAEVEGRPVWAEVSSSALTHNLRAIRGYVNPADEQRKTPRLVLSIVKGNGYGHGGPQVAQILEKAGSDWFGVTSASEGIEVRKAGVQKPILVLTSFWPGEEENLLKHDLTPVVHRCEQLAALNRVASKRSKRDPFSFHLKMDTGMNRLGISPTDVDCFAGQLAKCSHLQ